MIELLAEAESVTLLSIAVRSASLLLDGTTIPSKPTDPDNFRRVMRRKGLLQGEVRTDLPAPKTKMTEAFGHLGRVWPHVFATCVLQKPSKHSGPFQVRLRLRVREDRQSGRDTNEASHYELGPTLAPLLERARAEGWNIKRTAEAAGIHPRTVDA